MHEGWRLGAQEEEELDPADEAAGIKLADACKILKKKFSTGAAVTETADNKEEIEIQGDVKDDLVSVIVKEFKIDIKVPPLPLPSPAHPSFQDIFFVDGAGPKLTKIPVVRKRSGRACSLTFRAGGRRIRTDGGRRQVDVRFKAI